MDSINFQINAPVNSGIFVGGTEGYCGDDTTSNSEFLDAESNDEYVESPDNEEESQRYSIIHEIREELHTVSTAESLDPENGLLTESTSTSVQSCNEEEDDYLHDKVWLGKKKHVFILSEAGKPIYSLHGFENKLATLFGVIQVLVSFVQHKDDAITSIHAKGIKFVFIVRNSLILVAASRSKMSVPQLQLQLSDIYNQILSTLTYSCMNKIFEKQKNFDLRRLLSGSERFIDHLLVNDTTKKKLTNDVFTFLTNSIRVMPLSTNARTNITSAIQTNCSKIKNLVFAVLIANNKLICLIGMKKYTIHPADLRLIFNLIECSESFKTTDSNWVPICLPKFDMNGYLHAHISYLSDDCQACLLLLSVDRDAFSSLSEAKKNITEKLRRTHCLETINDEINSKGFNLDVIGIPELRHFLYKPKTISQILCAEIKPPYTKLEEFERLEAIYCDLHKRIHNTNRPLKLIYEAKEKEVVLAWITSTYELYCIFQPTVDKILVIKLIDKLIKSIEKEFDHLFIRNHSNF